MESLRQLALWHPTLLELTSSEQWATGDTEIDRGGGPARARVQVHSRWDDCDRYGHVNNVVYFALVRAAHDRAGLPAGELRAIEITFREPVPPEVVVDVDVAVVDGSESHHRVAYALQVDGRRAADVKALWHLSGPAPHVDLPPIDRDAKGKTFQFRHSVRSYEIGTNGAARPQAVLQWLEHAVFRGATVAADRARGAFLDLEGRVRPAPAHLLRDLLAGEPSA